MYNDDTFALLVKPMKQFLGSKKMFNDYVRSHVHVVGERNLRHLAELFAAMASNDTGYQYLIRAASSNNR